MSRFRKRPVVIEAWQLSANNHGAVAFRIAEAGYNVRHYSRPPMRAVSGLVIETLEGDMVAEYGDWIIRGVKGEFYPCKPDIFAATYEDADASDPAAGRFNTADDLAEFLDSLHQMDDEGAVTNRKWDVAQRARAAVLSNSPGVAVIATERGEHVSREGWTPEHDDQYDRGQLPLAAVCYAMFAACSGDTRDSSRAFCAIYGAPAGWPTDWNPAFWKPSKDNSGADRIRDLRKAGALIAAEIDRLLRTTGEGA